MAKSGEQTRIEWEDTLTFVFNEDCTLKRLKFADAVREKNADILKKIMRNALMLILY